MSGDPVQEIKTRLSILDVVAPYVELHKAGKSYKGKSPFSAERTPSFFVSPERGMYYCFSTSQGGDIFTFVQAMEGVDFKGALRILAEKAGVELIPERPEARSARERAYAALEAATCFYQTALNQATEAQEYLAQRGLSAQTIASWRIGYAPGPPTYGWRELKTVLEGDGYTTDELLRVGLIKQASAGKDPFDVFRDRIVFPMCDPSGRVVAFSGRILHPQETAPKYVNSPETALYKKSELLFGFDKAKQGIRKLDFTLIVEGQFDVVMAHQAGYTNTVAVSGTALTEQHVQLIERLSDRVVLALDADPAGIRAMKRAAELMLGRGIEVKVAALPTDTDPADLVAADRTQFKRVIAEAVHVIDFLLADLRRTYTDTRVFRQHITQEITPFILLLPSRVAQYSFAESIASAAGVPTDVIWHEIERTLARRSERAAAPAATEVEPTAPTTRSTDSVEGMVSWLAALRGVQTLLPESAADALSAQLSPLAIAAELPEVGDDALARAVFTFETEFASARQRDIEEAAIFRLNEFRKRFLNYQLQLLRDRLAQLTTGDPAEMDVQQQVNRISRLKSKPPLAREEVFVRDGAATEGDQAG